MREREEMMVRGKEGMEGGREKKREEEGREGRRKRSTDLGRKMKEGKRLQSHTHPATHHILLQYQRFLISKCYSSHNMYSLTIDEGWVAEQLQGTGARSRVFTQSVIEKGTHFLLISHPWYL